MFKRNTTDAAYNKNSRDHPSKRRKNGANQKPVGFVRYKQPSITTPQTNYVDVAYALYPANTTGSITLLNTIAQGTTVNTRVGKRVMMKGLQMRGLAQGDSTCAISEWAFLIVYDIRPRGALPLITDILDTISPNSFLNDTNAQRFRILHRSSDVNVGNSATAGTDKVAFNIDEYMKIPKQYREVVFNALGTGTIADIDMGALYLVTVGGNAAGTADSIIGLGTRLRYWDSPG